MKQSHAICGAKTRSGNPCQSRPMDNNRCRMHGGTNTGAPERNKNALKSGRYESILLDTLDDQELELFDLARDRDPLELLEEEIALTTVRERRMLKRIADLQKQALTLIEESTETIEAGEGGRPNISDRILAKLEPDEIDELIEDMDQAGAKNLTKIKQKRAGTLGQIQSIEVDLTAVQAHKAKLLKQKADLEAGPLTGRSVKVEMSGGDEGAIKVEVSNHGLSDDQRAEGLSALLDRVRTRSAGSVPPTEG